MRFFKYILALFLFIPVLAESATSVTVAAQGATGVGMCSVTNVYNQAAIQAWNTTPLVLVPTPPVGTTILFSSLTGTYNPTSTRYIWASGIGGNIYLGEQLYAGLTTTLPGFFGATPDFPHRMQVDNGPSIRSATTFTTSDIANQALTLRINNTANTGGDGDVTFTTRYYLLDSSGNITNQCPGTNPPPTVNIAGSDKVDVATHATGGSGSSSIYWTGWEVDLATNKSGTVCTTPSGYSVPTCLWPSGQSYYFRTGRYTQVYPVAFINTANPLAAPGSTYVEGPGRGLVYISYDPLNDDTSAFTLGRMGIHTFNTGFKHINFISPVSNTFTKTALDLIDVSVSTIEGNGTGAWCAGNSRGIRVRGREFIWIRNNYIQAPYPFYLEGQPVAADGGSSDGNHFNNVGYSKFNDNEFLVCGFVNSVIYVSPTAMLNDVVFSGNSGIFGGDFFHWVADFTGISDPSRKAQSHNIVIENYQWEQTSDPITGVTGNGFFVHINQTDNLGLIGLKINANNYGAFTNIAQGYTLNGIRLLNVHEVQIDGFRQMDMFVCGLVFVLSNVHNVRVNGLWALPLPSVALGYTSEFVAACPYTNQIFLDTGVCKTWQAPLSGQSASTGFGRNNTALPSAVIYDIPLDVGSCLP